MRFASPRAEQRLFQIVVIVASLVPILAGGVGALQGPSMVQHVHGANPDLDSHFRYLSGLLLGVGLSFLFCALDIERRLFLFRTLGLIVVVGGLARLLGGTLVGWPSGAQRCAFVMELLVVPALLLWLRRIERLNGGA